MECIRILQVLSIKINNGVRDTIKLYKLLNNYNLLKKKKNNIIDFAEIRCFVNFTIFFLIFCQFFPCNTFQLRITPKIVLSKLSIAFNYLPELIFDVLDKI